MRKALRAAALTVALVWSLGLSLPAMAGPRGAGKERTQAARPTGRPANSAPARAPLPPPTAHAQAVPPEGEGERLGDVAPHWLDAKPSAEETARTPRLAWLGVALLSAALGGGAVHWLARRHPGKLPREASERIELLAVRSLGGRQRLCLVAAGGERLLVGASEHEISLISHLPSLPAPEDEAATAPARGGAEAPFAAAVRAATANVPSPTPATEPLPDGLDLQPTLPAARPSAARPPSILHRQPSVSSRPTPEARSGQHASADVAGLIAWRTEPAGANR